MLLNNLFHFFSNKLRLNKPWNYKVPVLISLPYFQLLVNPVSNELAYTAIAFSYCTIIGIAGIAYLFNDWSDKQKDIDAGKPNALIDFSSKKFYALLGLFFSMTIVPWLWFPTTALSWVLLVTEIALFALYSFKPIRLKEKGILGLICDTLYAHTLPALLASYTFYLLGNKQFTGFSIYCAALIGWQFFLGMRNIVFHQLDDLENDQKSETKTWVSTVGIAKTHQLLTTVFIPLEVLFLLGISLLFTKNILWFLPFFVMHTLYVFFQSSKSDTKSKNLQEKTYAFLDNFYNLWLPIIFLLAMIFHPIEVTPILLVHLLFFQTGLWNSIKKLTETLKIKLRWFTDKLTAFETYITGLKRNIPFFLGYVGLFCCFYFVLEQFIPENQFKFFQSIWSKLLVLVMVTHLGFLVAARWQQTKVMLWNFLFETGSAYNLAIIRILFMLNLMGSYRAWALPELSKWALLPETSRQALPFMGWFIYNIPINETLYIVATQAAIICCVFASFGFLTRIALFIHIPLAIYVWGVPCFFGKLNHNQIAVWIPMLLAFAPCADVLSIDWLIKKIKKTPTQSCWQPKYGLPLKFIYLLLAMIYCFSGIHKLWDTGLIWALSDSVINQLYNEWVEHYDTIPNFRIDYYPALVKTGGLLTIIGEILYPLLLFHPVLRIVAFFGGNLFHRVTDYFLYIDFVKLRVLHNAYINWHGIVNWMIKKVRKIPLQAKANEKIITRESLEFKKLKPLLFVGIILLGINGIFSLFGIHSFPFSSYPTYSAYFENHIKTIEIEAFTSMGEVILVKQLSKKQNFRWENIRPFETDIINLYENQDTLLTEKKLTEYWQLWKTKVNGLNEVHTVNFYLVKTPLKPEKREEIIERKILLEMNVIENETGN